MKKTVLAFSAMILTGTASAETPAIPEVRAAIQQFIETHEIPGAITLVGDSEKDLHFDVSGHANIAENKPLAADSIFWIASMTKPITGTAIMMLEENGKLTLDDDIAKHLPEFKNLKDAAGNPATVTIRQCLTHSSGLAEVSAEESNGIATLTGLTPLVAAKPLQFSPGEKWQYCQSSINVAGRIVEVVSGESFPEYLKNHIFEPLGMTDTAFYLTEAQLPRLATSYAKNENGHLTEAGLGFLGAASPTDQNRYPRANGGLFSTASDYAKFARAILRGGELGGHRILSENSVKTMTAIHSGDLETGFTPGNAWAIAWCHIRTPQGVSAALSPASFGHGGAYGTQIWIDPTADRFYLLLTQRSNFPNSDASAVREQFQNLAAKHLPKPQ